MRGGVLYMWNSAQRRTVVMQPAYAVTCAGIPVVARHALGRLNTPYRIKLHAASAAVKDLEGLCSPPPPSPLPYSASAPPPDWYSTSFYPLK